MAEQTHTTGEAPAHADRDQAMERLLGAVAEEDRRAAPEGLEERLFDATRPARIRRRRHAPGRDATRRMLRPRRPLAMAAAAAAIALAGIGVWQSGVLVPGSPGAAAPTVAMSEPAGVLDDPIDAEIDLWLVSLDALEGEVGSEIDLLAAEIASLDSGLSALGDTREPSGDWFDGLGDAL